MSGSGGQPCRPTTRSSRKGSTLRALESHAKRPGLPGWTRVKVNGIAKTVLKPGVQAETRAQVSLAPLPSSPCLASGSWPLRAARPPAPLAETAGSARLPRTDRKTRLTLRKWAERPGKGDT